MSVGGGDYNPTTGTTLYQNVGLLGFLFESALDNMTAHAGGGQASATPITTEVSRVTTVANPADSVQLPPSQAGLTLFVINHGANPMQVFGNNAEGATIDDIATGTGVSQMPNSIVLYSCVTAGKWYTEGLATGFDVATGLQTVSYQDGISAAGSTQGGATPVNKMINNVTTVGSGSGVILPPSKAGMVITVNNNQGTNALLVYPATGEKINALAANAGFSLAANTVIILYCFTAGQWFTK